MVQRLEELEDSVKGLGHPDTQLTEAQWDQAKAIKRVLEILYKVNLRLQAADLTAGIVIILCSSTT